MMNDNLVSFISELFGRSLEDVQSLEFIPHTKIKLAKTSSNLVGIRVDNMGSEHIVSITSTLAVFLSQLMREIRDTNSIGEVDKHLSTSTYLSSSSFCLSPYCVI
jgi:hypothetical protein